MREMTIDRDSRFAWSLTWRRIASAVALTAALLATALRGAPALAAEATLTSLGVGLYDTVTGTTGGPFYMPDFVGSFHVSIDGGPTTEAYCVDIQHALTFGEPQPQVVPDYPPEVLYILRNAYPNPGTIGTPLADLTREAAAVQSAIWFFTDGFVITGPPDVQGRAVEIIEAAQEQCGEAATALHARTFLPVEEQCGPLPAVPNELTLSPAEATNYLPDQDSHTVTATLRDSQGQAIAGHDIEVVIAGAAGPQTFQGVTDAQGDFVVTYQNSLQVPGVDTITATAAFTAPVGLEFKAEGNQGIAIAGPPRPGTVTGTATKHWVPAACGDGVVNQAGEQCDDGNLVDDDGCDRNCTPTACGNGIVTVGEECDDGNTVNGDGCDNNCTVTSCGNGVAGPGEECDDGNATNGDGCDVNCTVSACSNGIVAGGEQCDDGNLVDGDGCDSNCTVTACGNGIVTAGEQCDDGNAVNGDGCDSNCTVTGCGNGIVTEGEQCDDGNLVDGDGCNSDCTAPVCGDGVVTEGEQCDDGNLVDGDGCDSNCTVTGCGNGIVTEGEQCDDGNLVDGDLCESDCTAARCGNGIVDQGEQCDDGNFQDGDGCDGMCRLQEICTNGIDDDGDGAIDCDDTDCACLPILRDPAVIRFSHTRPASSRARQRPDLLRVHGRIEPGTAHDAVAEGLTLLVTNAHGVVYKARLLPGDLQRRKSGMSFVDKAAARGAGTRDGLYRVRLRRGINDSLVVSIEAYGDLSAATLPAMTIQIGIGDDMFYTKGAFSSRRYGWYWAF